MKTCNLITSRLFCFKYFVISTSSTLYRVYKENEIKISLKWSMMWEVHLYPSGKQTRDSEHLFDLNTSSLKKKRKKKTSAFIQRESLNLFLKIHDIIICMNVIVFKYMYFILYKNKISKIKKQKTNPTWKKCFFKFLKN